MQLSISTTPGLPINEAVKRLDTYAEILSRCVLIMGSWVSDIPEAEVKIMLGNHIYKDATATYAIRNRLAQLGSNQDEKRVLSENWLCLITGLTQARSTLVRLFGMYRILKRELLHEIENYISESDKISDEPGVLVLQQIARELEEQIAWADSAYSQTSKLFYHSIPAADVEREWEDILRNTVPSDDLELPSPSKPARDNRFTVVANAPYRKVGNPEDTLITIHSMFMSIEIISIEVCGRMIADFPDMPYEFVLDMARQCWDESRHSLLFYNRLQQLGGKIGQYPIDTLLWNAASGLPLETRLAIQQRIGEWLGSDGAVLNMEDARKAGDEITAQMFEFIGADEINHVSYGNKWLRFLVPDKEKLKKVVDQALQRRLSFGKTIAGPPDLPLNRRSCERAGFLSEEIDELENIRLSRQPAARYGE
jgi:uncharacterized ferritin-like protein (DUF455 family)